jgi:hypothetical protein
VRDVGRDVVHQAGDEIGRAALGEVALEDREEVALDRPLDRDGDRRIELGDAAQAEDDGLGEGPVEPLEHGGRDLGAELGEDDGGGLRVLGLEEGGEGRDRRVVQPLPDRAHLAALAAVEEALDLVLVREDGGEELAGRFRAAGDLGPGGQEFEELHDDGVEDFLVDLAEAADRAREALHVGLGEVAEKARGEVRPDRGQDDGGLLDRARHLLGAERRGLRLLGAGGQAAAGEGEIGRRAHGVCLTDCSCGPSRRRGGSSRPR